MKIFLLYLLILAFLIVACSDGRPPTSDAALSKKEFDSDMPVDTAIEKIQILIPSFLGNEARNYYGEKPPSMLQLKWKVFLGGARSNMNTRDGSSIHYGAGWTGQPLLIKVDDSLYIFQGSYDHHVRKINVHSGRVIWKHNFGDAIKGTGSLWLNSDSENEDEKLVLIQGSRQGINTNLRAPKVFSLKGISGISGNELFRVNVENTPSASRDVDGSALIYKDTAYIGLENGLFLIFNPDPSSSSQIQSHRESEEIQKLKLYSDSDLAKRGGQIITESSPCKIGRMIYVAAGSGWIFGYNMDKKEMTWKYYIGADLNGTCVATEDSCLLVSVEKQFIAGNGGMLKLDPRKDPKNAAVWYFPVGNLSLSNWSGGIIGSASVNDKYKSKSNSALCAFSAIDGYLHVVEYRSIREDTVVKSFDGKTELPMPKLVFKYKIGSSISTPIMFSDKLIAAGYGGLYLFNISEFDDRYEFTLLDSFFSTFEATPIVYDNNIYIGAKDGFLYCFGDGKEIVSSSLINSDTIK